MRLVSHLPLLLVSSASSDVRRSQDAPPALSDPKSRPPCMPSGRLSKPFAARSHWEQWLENWLPRRSEDLVSIAEDHCGMSLKQPAPKHRSNHQTRRDQSNLASATVATPKPEKQAVPWPAKISIPHVVSLRARAAKLNSKKVYCQLQRA